MERSKKEENEEENWKTLITAGEKTYASCMMCQ